MKISIISFDLAHNCLGRAYLLGKVLQRRYEVEIIGSLFPQYGDSIWEPCDTGEFSYITFPGRKFPVYFSSINKLLKNISGDIIYALKLKLPSFGVGLIKKFLTKRPLLLDIDDLETSWYNPAEWNKIVLHSMINPIGYHYTALMERIVGLSDYITVASSQLQNKYGGILIPHGRDTNYLNPKNFNGNEYRTMLGIPQHYKIIMFLGTPRPHKGLEDILLAIKSLGRKDIKLVIVGGPFFTDCRYSSTLSESDYLVFDKISFVDIPKYLTCADLVVIPQRRSLQSSAQVPAKVFDAMAMAKPIIATRVSDLPQILEGCGILVEPGNITEIKIAIDWIISNTIEAKEMGLRAREKCIKEYNWDVMEERLRNLIDRL